MTDKVSVKQPLESRLIAFAAFLPEVVLAQPTKFVPGIAVAGTPAPENAASIEHFRNSNAFALIGKRIKASEVAKNRLVDNIQNAPYL
ncbi:MAG: hypothetical protein AB8B94_07325 [Hyphomicrobiales bacterium]